MKGLEQARYQAQTSFKRRIAEKETQNPSIIAKVGNGAGTVVVPGRTGWIYIRLHGDDNQLAQAKLGIPLNAAGLNDSWVKVRRASPRKASYYVVEQFITSSGGDPTPPLQAHALDPNAGPHTGALTEDDVTFADGGHAHSSGAGGQKVTAANVINVAAGGIAATDVQAAINELDTEKAGIAKGECARVYHSVAQATANATLVALAFDSERFDTDGIHDTVTNNSRLTCKTAGKYQITVNLDFASNATGSRRVYLKVNGATFIAGCTAKAEASGAHHFAVSTLWDLAVDNYVEVVVYQSSGGALNVDSGSSYSPEFMMVRVA